MVIEHEPSGVPDDEPGAVIAAPPSVTIAAGPWYRRWGVLTCIALVALAAVAALVFANGRADDANSAAISPSQSESTLPAGENGTLEEYFKENGITSTPVRRAEDGGDPGAPVIGMGLLPGYTRTCRAPFCSAELRGVGAGASGRRSLAAETSEFAYGAAQWDSAVDENDPPTLVVLLSKLTGDVDPAAILEYAPGELKNLPNYEPLAEDDSSTLSGFDAVQLAGHYMLDGKQRIVAQKTVIIPGKDALYVLQMNADGLDGDSDVLMQATALIDERTVITP